MVKKLKFSIPVIMRSWFPEPKPSEPIEVYEEDGKTIKRYPPGNAWGSSSGPTVKSKKRTNSSD